MTHHGPSGPCRHLRAFMSPSGARCTVCSARVEVKYYSPGIYRGKERLMREVGARINIKIQPELMPRLIAETKKAGFKTTGRLVRQILEDALANPSR